MTESDVPERLIFADLELSWTVNVPAGQELRTVEEAEDVILDRLEFHEIEEVSDVEISLTRDVVEVSDA